MDARSSAVQTCEVAERMYCVTRASAQVMTKERRATTPQLPQLSQAVKHLRNTNLINRDYYQGPQKGMVGQ